MKFGVCGDIARAVFAAEASYDYMEGNVVKLLRPGEPEESFAASLEEIKASPLPFAAANCFVPGDLKITGPEVNTVALKDYVTAAMTRARKAGIDTIVFGSGGARNIPDGFKREAAHEQLVWFCRMTGPVAADNGVTVAVEPLSRSDCNVLTSVGECGDLVREVDHPAIRLLVDSYHLMKNEDPIDEIVDNGDLLAHVHIATSDNRVPPGVEPCDMAPFFTALRKAGYDGRISIEGKIETPQEELVISLKYMKEMV